MRVLGGFLLAASSLFGQTPNTLTPAEAAEGWILLFDGRTLFGWTKDGPTDWHVVDGVLTGDGEGRGWLRTNASFSGYMLKCDFRTGGAGVGVVLGASKQGGYPLPSGPPGAAPAGRWHTYEVTTTAAGFLVTLDGNRIAGGKEGPNVVGPIGLEHTKGNKVEYRNIKLKPLGANPLFDGKTLTGWRKVNAPETKTPAVWSVRDGMLHVERGPGELETAANFGNFVLQIGVRANAPDPQHHPDSGIFFRGTPGGFWTGYQAQIRNEWENDDRNKPVDFGTGGIYHYRPARRVVSTDGEFFTMTIATRGRHISVWVNGYAVSDWENARPDAKLAGGPIGLQAHDPATNLDFRDIRIAELPRSPESPMGRAAQTGHRLKRH